MDLIFKGTPDEIERFISEVIYPVIRERQGETDGHYFRITEDKGEYRSRKKDNIVTRRVRGYFPGSYYKVDIYADKYKAKGGENMTLYEIRELGDKLEALKDNLFSVKGALFHGEIESRTADNALAVVVESLGEIAEKLQNASMSEDQ